MMRKWQLEMQGSLTMANMQNMNKDTALRLAEMLTADEWPGSVTLVSYARECVAELLRQHAENGTLRTGYAAARLEIESLNAQLHAAKQINAAQFGLLAASIPGSALRASHWQAPAQAAAPAQADEYPALVCDYCGALTPDPWHSSGMLHGKMSKHIHSCDACAALAAAPAQPAAEASRFGSPELQAMIIARCVEKDQADSVQEDADRYRWLRERSSTMFVNISINGVSIHARHH